MKVLLINSYYSPNSHGGADRSVQLLAEGLYEAGDQVVVVSLSGGSRSDIRTVNGVKVRYLAVNSAWSHIRERHQTMFKKVMWQAWTAVNPSMTQALREILKEEKPELIHTHIIAGFSTKPWSVAHEFGLPIVHTLRDYFLICPRGTMSRGNGPCPRQCRHCSVAVAARRMRALELNAVVGVSNYVLDEHVQRGYFVSVPIKARIFNSAGHEPTPLPSRGHSNGVLHIGFLGRIEPFKGIDHLLSSVNTLDDRRVNVSIAGTDSDDLIKRIRKQWPLNNVAFHGQVDPESFLPQIDLLVVPSTYHDPAPRVILEAYRHGVPVLGSSLGGIPELVDDGRTGWIFDASNKGSLADRLHQLVEHPELCRRMRAECRREAGLFSTDRMVEHHLDVYQHAIRSVSR